MFSAHHNKQCIFSVVKTSLNCVCMCQDSSEITLLCIDPVVSGSDPLSAKFSLGVGELSALCNYRRRNHEVWSH